jgi:rare lipoprotein A
MREWVVLVALGAFFLGVLLYSEVPRFYEVGIASWYGPGFQGKTTANGELYDMFAYTAAHKTLPFGTVVEVVNLETGRSVVVRINDRGPFIPGRIIDLSYVAAQELGIVDQGTARVGLIILWMPKDGGGG